MFLAVSCSEDRLNEKPLDQFPIENAISDEQDMRQVLNGVYDEYSGVSGFGADILAFGDLISDNVFISSTNNDASYRNVGFLNWSADSGDFNMLSVLYSGITLANAVINNTSVEASDNVDNLKGEAMIARGLGYYYAVSFYSANPTSNLNQDLGVPLNLGGYNPDLKIPRASVSEVYDQIIKDLTNGISLMTNEMPKDKGYLSPTAARMLLSRVYLTRGKAGDYEKALQYSNEVINSAGSSSFDFVQKENYVDYFTNQDVAISENQPETVWEINMNAMPSENPGVNSALAVFYANNGGKRRFLFRDTFYKTFAASDIRSKLFQPAGAPSEGTNPKGVWTKKYIVKTSKGNFTQNVKVLRMSEAYLNKMEALVKLGRNPEALIVLNDFATSRGAVAYTTANLENVLTERRKEFFGEGQRYFDLKRNNLGFSNATNCYSIVCSVTPDSRLFVIPMPLREMNVNPNMKQYPGY
ncbi:RagB/SusD family nutrient uptake outer membrane protein [Soonwooa buanensis]|nr:RagB/SusD family nutrient uptake outer membrane protein [Soonwooa buanensis]